MRSSHGCVWNERCVSRRWKPTVTPSPVITYMPTQDRQVGRVDRLVPQQHDRDEHARERDHDAEQVRETLCAGHVPRASHISEDSNQATTDQTPRLSGRYTRVRDVHDSPMPDEVLLPGLVAIEHMFDVPLDHGDDAGERITVFARELADPDGRDRPFLVYLQGGPGFEAPRPTRKPTGPAGSIGLFATSAS